MITYIKHFASGLYWNFAKTKLHQTWFFNISNFNSSIFVHSHYQWINDCDKKETSHWNDINQESPKNLDRRILRFKMFAQNLKKLLWAGATTTHSSLFTQTWVTCLWSKTPMSRGQESGSEGCPKMQQTKMLVTCQRFGDLFLFELVW